MIIFFAAVFSNEYFSEARQARLNDHEKAQFDAIPYFLESYHYLYNKPEYVAKIRERSEQVFLDSGAFSAYNLGIDITVEDYVKFINEHRDMILVHDGTLMASVLDGIGDPLLTYQNQKKMERMGITPLPCFHSGEDERYLEYYIQNYEYITLGGMVGSTTKQLQLWLDRLWNEYLIDGSGNPRLKVHGFGITSVKLMERYPWYSCDSSTWVKNASFGNVVHPKYGSMGVSEKSPARHDHNRHISTYRPVERDAIVADIARLGFDVDKLATTYESRAAFNVMSFKMIQDRLSERSVEPSGVQGLF